MITTPINTAPVRIKANMGYYTGTLNAPKDGYLMGYDTTTPLEFAAVADAYAYLTSSDDYYCEYDGDGDFSVGGKYETYHGQHSRPRYTIVSAKSGRCTKAIKAACEDIKPKL